MAQRGAGDGQDRDRRHSAAEPRGGPAARPARRVAGAAERMSADRLDRTVHEDSSQESTCAMGALCSASSNVASVSLEAASKPFAIADAVGGRS
jgi:hypothetical protein